MLEEEIGHVEDEFGVAVEVSEDIEQFLTPELLPRIFKLRGQSEGRGSVIIVLKSIIFLQPAINLLGSCSV